MRLGYKSQVLLDMLIAAGADALRALYFPTSAITSGCGWEEPRSATRHLKKMEQEGWIVWDDSQETGKWALRITQAGRQAATDHPDPEASWSRPWDGKWRMIAFDLPASKQPLRRELLGWLRQKRFGKLQDSLWITPCYDPAWEEDLKSLKFDPSGVSFVEGVSFSRSSDSSFVNKSWNFPEINRRHAALIEFHRTTPATRNREASDKWIQTETKLWRDALDQDPLLPDALLPRNYLGKKALATRRQTYSTLVSI